MSRAVADRAAGKAAVDKALEAGRNIQGNRAADKALADKAAAQASKDKTPTGTSPGRSDRDQQGTSGGSNATRRAEGGLISKPQKTARNKKGLAS